MNTHLKSFSEKNVAAPMQNETNSYHRILLVDDDIYLRELFAGVLIRSGYDVDTAKDGADAWTALNDASYGLLITDHDMPRVTGLDLIKKLRSEDMTLPIILASGTVPAEELKRHPWLMLDATLTKPFTIEQFLEAVKQVLRSADNARSRVEKEFPMILKAIGEIEPPPRHKRQPPSVIKSSEATSVEESGITPIQDQTNSARRILVVDDDGDNRQLSVDVLSGSGYEVEGAKDGAAGWEALQANTYDLIITDNKMPRMTGIEMLEKLRSARKTVPVIMATGILPTHEFARKPWLKPDATLQKPFSNDDLLATVKKVLCSDGGGISKKHFS